MICEKEDLQDSITDYRKEGKNRALLILGLIRRAATGGGRLKRPHEAEDTRDMSRRPTYWLRWYCMLSKGSTGIRTL
jgi:hypothetical protein